MSSLPTTRIPVTVSDPGACSTEGAVDARGRARTRETRIKDDDGDAMVFEFNDDATTRARRESARTRTLTNAATIRLQTGV